MTSNHLINSIIFNKILIYIYYRCEIILDKKDSYAYIVLFNCPARSSSLHVLIEKNLATCERRDAHGDVEDGGFPLASLQVLIIHTKFFVHH